jgi:hypothetical protein
MHLYVHVRQMIRSGTSNGEVRSTPEYEACTTRVHSYGEVRSTPYSVLRYSSTSYSDSGTPTPSTPVHVLWNTVSVCIIHTWSTSAPGSLPTRWQIRSEGQTTSFSPGTRSPHSYIHFFDESHCRHLPRLLLPPFNNIIYRTGTVSSSLLQNACYSWKNANAPQQSHVDQRGAENI